MCNFQASIEFDRLQIGEVNSRKDGNLDDLLNKREHEFYNLV